MLELFIRLLMICYPRVLKRTGAYVDNTPCTMFGR